MSLLKPLSIGWRPNWSCWPFARPRLDVQRRPLCAPNPDVQADFAITWKLTFLFMVRNCSFVPGPDTRAKLCLRLKTDILPEIPKRPHRALVLNA